MSPSDCFAGSSGLFSGVMGVCKVHENSTPSLVMVYRNGAVYAPLNWGSGKVGGRLAVQVVV